MALQIVVGVVAVVAVLVLCGKKMSLAPQTTIFGGVGHSVFVRSLDLSLSLSHTRTHTNRLTSFLSHSPAYKIRFFYLFAILSLSSFSLIPFSCLVPTFCGSL